MSYVAWTAIAVFAGAIVFTDTTKWIPDPKYWFKYWVVAVIAFMGWLAFVPYETRAMVSDMVLGMH